MDELIQSVIQAIEQNQNAPVMTVIVGGVLLQGTPDTTVKNGVLRMTNVEVQSAGFTYHLPEARLRLSAIDLISAGSYSTPVQ